MKAVFISIVIVLFFFDAAAQEEDYSLYVGDKLINKKQTIQTTEGKKELVYLGKIKNDKGKILYHIIAMYSEVQAAIVIHGHSNVLYLDEKKFLKRQFELSVPDELPYKLVNNTFYFLYYNNKTKRKEQFHNHVGTDIPKLLCVKADDCY
jgi:hypothetical protein